jgi:succinoglycan biosynthesis protein ExoA
VDIDGESDAPLVSVIIPVLDEAPHLEAAVAAVLRQRYPRPLEVVLAVGPSGDGTEEIAERLAAEDARVQVVANPTGRTAAGLNLAIAASSGDVIARVDGHAELSEGYLLRAVSTLDETSADNVGGIQHAVGHTPTQQAIAAAMTSRFGVGDARFHYGGAHGPVDTVYLGVFRRSALTRVGGFDETLVRNQDYELNWRIRQSGGVVWFDPQLIVTYAPRPTLRRLADQYHQYGRWKRLVLRRNPRSMRWRQLVAPAAVVANVGGLLVGFEWRPALLAPGAYVTATLVATVAARHVPLRVRWRLPAVFATMHHTWGFGFLRGIDDPASAAAETTG